MLMPFGRQVGKAHTGRLKERGRNVWKAEGVDARVVASFFGMLSRLPENIHESIFPFHLYVLCKIHTNKTGSFIGS